jgi:hypothetical protein
MDLVRVSAKDGTPLTIHYNTSVVACTPPVVPVP